MSVKLLVEHHLEFSMLKRRLHRLSESSLVKMPHCWKSHVVAHIQVHFRLYLIMEANTMNTDQIGPVVQEMLFRDISII